MVSSEKKFLVKHKYVAQAPDELTLMPGDVVLNVDADGEEFDPGWAKGRVHNKVGMYPTNFVEPLKDSLSTESSSKAGTRPSTKSSKKDSDQHKQDLKADASEDEIDGFEVVPSASSLDKSKSASQGSLDDMLCDQSDNKNVKSKKRGIFKKVFHKTTASDVIPMTSEVSSTSATSNKSSPGVSPVADSIKLNSTSASPVTKTASGGLKVKKAHKSMESLHSAEDEHENVSRGSSSSTERLAEGVRGSGSGLTSPEASCVPGALPDSLELDVVANLPDNKKLGVRKPVPKQNNKRAPTRDKLRQDAETAEIDRAQALEVTAVVLNKEGSAFNSGIGESASEANQDPRVKVGVPAGPGAPTNIFALPGGANLLSEIKAKQTKNAQSPDQRPRAPSNSVTATPSSSAAPVSNSPAATSRPQNLNKVLPISSIEARKSVFSVGDSKPSPAAPPPAKPQKPTPATRASVVSPTGPAPSNFPGVAAKPTTASSSPSSSSFSSTFTPGSVHAEPHSHGSPFSASPANRMVSSNNPVTHAHVQAKPSRPPPPQVPEKPKDISSNAALEAEVRTVKDTVTRLERRIKELEGQLEEEQEARRKLEAKVDAFINSK